MLFNARAFWLFRSVRNTPVSLVEGEWGARGSRALVRRFFEAVPVLPPLVLLLRQLCRELAVAPRRVAADAGGVLRREEEEAVAAADASAFLGSGGSARVVCCVSDVGEAVGALRALKVSATLSRAELEHEFSTLQAAAAAGAPVVPDVEGSLRHVRLDDGVHGGGAHGGGGVLLSDECARAVLTSCTRCKAAFRSLWALHAAGFVHGDARVPSLVLRGRSESLSGSTCASRPLTPSPLRSAPTRVPRPAH